MYFTQVTGNVYLMLTGAGSIIGMFTFTTVICTPNIEDPQSGIEEAHTGQEITIFEVSASGSFLSSMQMPAALAL
jgi:hypothetical protein